MLFEERQKEGIGGEVIGLEMLCWVQVGRLFWGQVIGLFCIWGVLLRVQSGLIGFYTSMLLFIILRLRLSCVRYMSSLTEEIAFLRMLSSCAEESISAVHNNGTQHDGFLTPDIAKAEMQ